MDEGVGEAEWRPEEDYRVDRGNSWLGESEYFEIIRSVGDGSWWAYDGWNPEDETWWSSDGGEVTAWATAAEATLAPLANSTPSAVSTTSTQNPLRSVAGSVSTSRFTQQIGAVVNDSAASGSVVGRQH